MFRIQRIYMNYFLFYIGKSKVGIELSDNSIYTHASSPGSRIYGTPWTEKDIMNLINGGKIVSSSGREYDSEEFARLMIFAVCLKKRRYDLSELEELAVLHKDDYKYMAFVLENHYYRFISNGIRFGCGHRIIDGKLQYFAFYCTPDRNSDYYVYTIISEQEFRTIEKDYPDNCEIKAYDHEKFCDKYIKGHKGIKSGMDCEPDATEDMFRYLNVDPKSFD